MQHSKIKAAEFFFLACNSPSTSSTGTILVQWLPPPINSLKLNIDASHNNESYLFVVGGLLRNHNGLWLGGFSSFIGAGSALLVELWAIFNGFKFYARKIFTDGIIESESKMAVKLILDPDSSADHAYWPLIASCRSELNALRFELNHIYREANRCADLIGKKALLDRSELQIFHDIPIFLADAFGDDLAGKSFIRKLGIG